MVLFPFPESKPGRSLKSSTWLAGKFPGYIYIYNIYIVVYIYSVYIYSIFIVYIYIVTDNFPSELNLYDSLGISSRKIPCLTKKKGNTWEYNLQLKRNSSGC